MTSKNINSIYLRDGKIVINNTKEFLIKKRLIQPNLTNNGEPLVISMDKFLLSSENEGCVTYVGDMPSLEAIETNTDSSVLEGDYVITYVDEEPQEEIVNDESQQNLPEETSLQMLDDFNPQVIHEDRTQEKEKSLERTVKPKFMGKLGKRRCCCSDDEDSPSDNEWEDIPKGYKSILELLRDLVTRELIDPKFMVLLAKGLYEMKVDVVQELKEAGRKKHSYELLTFAYMLFFKKRRAYVFLQKVYTSHWPTKTDLREWRNLVNKNRKRLKNAQQSISST